MENNCRYFKLSIWRKIWLKQFGLITDVTAKQIQNFRLFQRAEPNQSTI
jgi:hypothetical protein